MHRKIVKVVYQNDKRQAGVKIRRALGPMTCKIACGPSKLTLGGPANFEVTIVPSSVPLTK